MNNDEIKQHLTGRTIVDVEGAEGVFLPEYRLHAPFWMTGPGSRSSRGTTIDGIAAHIRFTHLAEATDESRVPGNISKP